MSTFPSVISTISTPAATDKLNAPSHSGIESGQNDAIAKLETFIGTLSSVQGTLMYDIRAAASPGGGHVQGANKGGTGQTAYTKGDLLVAPSTSVLSKLGVGTDGQILTADSTQSAGVKWGAAAATATDIQNQTYIYARASVISGSVYGVVLNQAVSVLSDGLGLVVKFPKANATSIVALQVNATGPSSLTALIKNTALSNLGVGNIQASMIGVLEFDSVSSVFQLQNPIVANPITLLKSGTGTDQGAGATNVDTVSISGLTALDSLMIVFTCNSLTQATAEPTFYNNTDGKKIADIAAGAALSAGTTRQGPVFINQEQHSSTILASATNDAGGNSPATGGDTGTAAGGRQYLSSVTTPWTSAWTLAFRHGGVTAGGTFRWSWMVYKVAGQ